MCPKDMHVFSLIEVNKHFDAKASTNFREYDYYMPSFMLQNEIELKYEWIGEMLPPIKGKIPHCQWE